MSFFRKMHRQTRQVTLLRGILVIKSNLWKGNQKCETFFKASWIDQKAGWFSDRQEKKDLTTKKGGDFFLPLKFNIKIQSDELQKCSALTIKLKVVLEWVPGVPTNFDRKLTVIYCTNLINRSTVKKYDYFFKKYMSYGKKVFDRSTEMLSNTWRQMRQYCRRAKKVVNRLPIFLMYICSLVSLFEHHT